MSTFSRPLSRRFARLAALSLVAAAGVIMSLSAVPARAVTHIDAIFDCAAIEASNTAVPKFWAEAGDTVTVIFRNCYDGTSNSFYIFGGNDNGMFLNQDSLINATNQGLPQQWIVRDDDTKTGDWTLNGTIQATANGGSVALGGGNLTIGYYSLPNLGGATAWRLGGAGPTQTLTPLTQTIAGTVNQQISPSTAFTATNFAGSVSYSVMGPLPAGLSMDSATGVISGTPTITQSATSYTVFARGTSATMIATVTISVDVPTPSISGGPASVSATAGQPLSPTSPFTVENFSCTPVFSVDPALPDGLSLDSGSGVISGTPSGASASSTYTVTAACNSESATAVVSLGVASPDPTISLERVSFSIVAGEQLAPTPAIVTENFSCTPTFSISPDLPAGLTLDAQTGSLSGSPHESSSSASYVVSATCDAEVAESTITLEVTSANPVDNVADGLSSLVNTGFSTLGPSGLVALTLAIGIPMLWFVRRVRWVRHVGAVVVHSSEHLTILTPARFVDSIRRRTKK